MLYAKRHLVGLGFALGLIASADVSAQQTTRAFDASWNAVGGAVDYCLYHDTQPGPPYADRQCVGNRASFQWTLPVETGSDYFVVTAVDSSGAESDFSIEVLVTTTLDADGDGDGVQDVSDNCPNTANANQLDTDADGDGNVCDSDDDNDGMPDTFENANGLNPTDATDAGRDADNDGFSNLQEYQAGTDPNDGGSSPVPVPEMSVTFDDPAPADLPGPLNGTFDGIDFGTGQWLTSGPAQDDTTNHIYLSGDDSQARTFSFASGPRRLDSLLLYVTVTNGTLTLTDDTGQTVSGTFSPGQMHLLTTNWSNPSNTITVQFNDGWHFGISTVTHAGAGGPVDQPAPDTDTTILISIINSILLD